MVPFSENISVWYFQRSLRSGRYRLLVLALEVLGRMNKEVSEEASSVGVSTQTTSKNILVSFLYLQDQVWLIWVLAKHEIMTAVIHRRAFCCGALVRTVVCVPMDNCVDMEAVNGFPDAR